MRDCLLAVVFVSPLAKLINVNSRFKNHLFFILQRRAVKQNQVAVSLYYKSNTFLMVECRVWVPTAWGMKLLRNLVVCKTGTTSASFAKRKQQHQWWITCCLLVTVFWWLYWQIQTLSNSLCTWGIRSTKWATSLSWAVRAPCHCVMFPVIQCLPLIHLHLLIKK